MKFTAEHWRAARKNILAVDGMEPSWQSVNHLRVFAKRGTVKLESLVRITGHDGQWTVREILAACPPGLPNTQAPEMHGSFEDAVNKMILLGMHGKAIVWDRQQNFSVYDEDDHLPPGYRQIITGTEFSQLLARNGAIAEIAKQLATQLFSLYDSSESNNANYEGAS